MCCIQIWIWNVFHFCAEYIHVVGGCLNAPRCYMTRDRLIIGSDFSSKGLYVSCWEVDNYCAGCWTATPWRSHFEVLYRAWGPCGPLFYIRLTTFWRQARQAKRNLGKYAYDSGHGGSRILGLSKYCTRNKVKWWQNISCENDRCN
jgi:hypothetical protein